MSRAPIVVVTDLDGTLLDHETYSFDAARPALTRLRDERIPLILCTSKTRAEVEPLHAALALRHPFVVENGGGIYIPDGYFPFPIADATRRESAWLLSFGDSYADLVAALARASRVSGVAVRGFSSMTDADVAATTGLALPGARRACLREFDEPFEVLDPGRERDLVAAIEREGKQVTKGGRFHHIVGRNDKAVAVRRLVELFERDRGAVRTVGLGDAVNDAGFLSVVDVPIVVASPRVEQLRVLLPHARVTDRPGPAGWNDAVLAVLDEHR
jgi:mannosyl-3-phosphoglycerate phosphatase